MLDALIFAAHPDDAEIFCGGTIAVLTRQGSKVGVVDLTQGELASQGSVTLRQTELECASKILGLAHRENLSLPDGGLDELSAEQLHAVVGAIRRLQPSLVFLPFEQDRHPDHVQASKLCERATFMANLKKYSPVLGTPHQALQVIYYQMRTSFRPSFLVDVTESYETKRKSIEAFTSQIQRDSSGSQSLISSPLSISSIVARDEYYGSMLGVKYAEPFYLKTALGIKDPMSFFKNNPLREPLASPGVSHGG